MNELGRSPEEILEEAKGFPMSVADETLWLLGKGGSGEMTEEEKRRYWGYSDSRCNVGRFGGNKDQDIQMRVWNWL